MIKEDTKIKIFVAHHKPGYIYEDDVYVPIQVGKKKAKIDLGIIGDDTGDNISEKNDSYAELTAQYWVWKNYDLSDVDYVGFCHYRRYMTYCYKPRFGEYLFVQDHNLSFGGKRKLEKKIYARGEGNCFFNYNEELLHNNSQSVKQYVDNSKVDIYTVKREPNFTGRIFSKMNIRHANPFNFCYGCRERKIELKNLFLKIYPDYEKIIKEIEEECKTYSPLHRHLFIMKKNLFFDYMDWLFNYLFEVEKYIKIRHLETVGIYGKPRFMGIFSEVFINYRKTYMQETKNIKVLSNSNLILFK